MVITDKYFVFLVESVDVFLMYDIKPFRISFYSQNICMSLDQQSHSTEIKNWRGSLALLFNQSSPWTNNPLPVVLKSRIINTVTNIIS